MQPWSVMRMRVMPWRMRFISREAYVRNALSRRFLRMLPT